MVWYAIWYAVWYAVWYAIPAIHSKKNRSLDPIMHARTTCRSVKQADTGGRMVP